MRVFWLVDHTCVHTSHRRFGARSGPLLLPSTGQSMRASDIRRTAQVTAAAAKKVEEARATKVALVEAVKAARIAESAHSLQKKKKRKKSADSREEEEGTAKPTDAAQAAVASAAGKKKRAKSSNNNDDDASSSLPSEMPFAVDSADIPDAPTVRSAYRDRFVGADFSSGGDWRKDFGSDGHLFWSYQASSVDSQQLPAYVTGVHINTPYTGVRGKASRPNFVSCSSDRRALELPAGGATAGCRALGGVIGGTVATIDIAGSGKHNISLYESILLRLRVPCTCCVYSCVLVHACCI